MARNHARLLVSIWDDVDFVSLDPGTQIVYLSLLSSSDLSWCGVAPLLPKRIVPNAKGLTERKVTASIGLLAYRRLLVVDDTTAEVCVRTYIRHDGIMGQPNIVKAMARAVDKVRSASIRAAIVAELARLAISHPGEKGWATLSNTFPDLYAEVTARALPNPSRNPSRNPSVNPLAKGA